MKRVNPAVRAWLVAFALALLPAHPLFASAPPAELVVQQTTDRMLELIEEAKVYVDSDRERFFREVEALLSPVVDFERFARSVMAAHYRDATPAQRDRFEEGFKWSLVRTYAVALTEFDGGEVVIIPSELAAQRSDRVNVKQEIRMSGGEVYPVIYSMALSEDRQWRMRNIIVNGVNMGLTYRNQFASAAQDAKYGGDMDRVIEGWIASVGDEHAQAEAENGTAVQAATSPPVGEALD